MASCSYCGTTILFGGVSDGPRRFCNQRCAQQGRLLTLCDTLPQELVDEHLLQVHEGSCPNCRGPGPIDVHVGHRVWSALLLTSSSSAPRVCCRRCGIKHQLGSLMMSATCGWWGFPWGLIWTPVQIGRNIAGMVNGPDPKLPSTQLEKIVRMQIGMALAQTQHQAQRQQPAPPTARV